MKTELKTAEQHLKYELLKKPEVPAFYCAIKAIESHTSERLDHLRQQLEEWRDEAHYEMYRTAYSEAISLIDQLKAETKNTQSDSE